MTDSRDGTLFFEPMDVLFFRDYRPADAGWNVLGQSMFPLPSVTLGCVRGALFRALGANFNSRDDEHYGVDEQWATDLLGGRSGVGTLQLHGPVLARCEAGQVEPLFAMPADMTLLKGDGEGAMPQHVVAKPERLSAIPDGPRCYRRGGDGMEESRIAIAWTSKEPAKASEQYMLTEHGMRAYLTCTEGAELPLTVAQQDSDRDRAHLVATSKLMELENRFGHARTSSLTVEPHMFYFKRPYRLAPHHGFAVQVTMPDPSEPAGELQAEAIRDLHGKLVTLGGRGHRARVSFHERPLIAADLCPSGPVSKAVFITPAPLPDGCSTWPEGLSGVAERLQPVGGFDQGKRRPRPLRHALPAGSVVYASSQKLTEITASLCKLDRDSTDGENQRLRRAGFAWALGQAR